MQLDKKDVYVFKCPVCEKKLCSSEPEVVLADMELQSAVDKILFSCPFQKFGCTQRVEGAKMVQHLVQCDKCPHYCQLCQGWTKDAHSECMTKCQQCDRNIVKDMESEHQKFCLLKQTKPQGHGSNKWTQLSGWEKEYLEQSGINLKEDVSEKECVERSQSLWNAHGAKVSHFLSELSKPSYSVAPVSINLDDTLLKESMGYSLKLLSRWSQRPDKPRDEAVEATAHLRIGLAIEEDMLLQSIHSNRKKKSTSKDEGQQAIDSGIEDELNGLLDMLGIESTESDINKLKAVQEEYERLLQMGLSHEASEVQNLYQWKVKQLSSAGNNEKGKQFAQDQAQKREHALQKYYHSLSLNTTNAEVK
jgi:hypothetical protein